MCNTSFVKTGKQAAVIPYGQYPVFAEPRAAALKLRFEQHKCPAFLFKQTRNDGKYQTQRNKTQIGDYAVELLGKIFGAKPVLLCAIAVYVGVSFYGAAMPTGTIGLFGFDVSPMFVLAALIGMVQGGVQALFGFYSMIGRCSTILGPLLIAGVAAVFPAGEDGLFSTRAGIASLTLLFLAGMILLTRVKRAPAAKGAARP